MDIPIEKLTTLVEEAYELGLGGCAELKSQEVKDLFEKFQINDNDDYRIWKIEELKKYPVGSVFNHLIRGRCWIVERSNGTKFMQFDKGYPIELLSETDPWNKPMKLLHSVEG